MIYIAKFLFIITCFILSFSYGRNVVCQKDVWLLRGAMLFTVFADYHLMIAGQYTHGLAFFCIVQCFYIVRYGGAGKLKWALGAAMLGTASLFTGVPPLYALAVTYAALFGISLFSVMRRFKRKNNLMPMPNGRMILGGMVLFALCDINVALFNNGPATYAALFYTLIWVFYLPSQFLLALSAKRFAGHWWLP